MHDRAGRVPCRLERMRIERRVGIDVVQARRRGLASSISSMYAALWTRAICSRVAARRGVVLEVGRRARRRSCGRRSPSAVPDIRGDSGPMSCRRHDGCVMYAVGTASSERCGGRAARIDAGRRTECNLVRSAAERSVRGGTPELTSRWSARYSLSPRTLTGPFHDPSLRLPSRHRRRPRDWPPMLAQLGRIVVGKDEPLQPRARLPARARPPADRGHSRRRQVDARAGARARRSVSSTRASSSRATCCRRTCSACRSTTSATRRSASTRARSSTRSCSPTRSTARRPRRRARCSRRWRSGRCRMDGQTRTLPDPFFVIATQNPIEQIGAYPLPESQLDRFLMAIELGYPDRGGGARAARRRRPPRAHRRSARRWPIPRRSPTGSARRPAIHVAPALLDYVQALLAASRGHCGGTATARRCRRAPRPEPARRAHAARRRRARARWSRGAPDGAARRRAGGVPVRRGPSARRRRARRRRAGADAACAPSPLPYALRLTAASQRCARRGRPRGSRRTQQRALPPRARRRRAGRAAPFAHLHPADAARLGADRDAR